MPDVLIEVRNGWLAGEESRFLDAIQTAIADILGSPKDDKILRLIEHSPGHFAIPTSAGDKFTHIEITMFAGRTLATKRSLYKAIVRNLEPFGVPAKDIKIILIEVSPESVGMKGGIAACDLDIGYEIQL